MMLCVFQHAALAVGPMTITSNRQKIIDFTEPFYTDGVSILMKRIPEEGFSVLQPLRPLSALVWLALPGVLVIISLSMFFVEKTNPPREDKRKFTVGESFWFTIASFSLRAIDTTPRSIAGRILGVCLWFASLMIMSSYAANLAAMLTVTRLRVPVTSLEDLALQTSISYGTVRDSYTSAFFQNSRVPHLQRMWRVMSAADGEEEESLVRTDRDGFNKVRESQGDYAFLWDSSRVRYEIGSDCSLAEVGEVFGIREYAFAVPKGVHYREKFSQVLLKMRESGHIQEIESRFVCFYSEFLCHNFSTSYTPLPFSSYDILS